ncbi:MAG: pyridoxal-dependent decarboxylase [Saprospiraceae bacterium]|nr:pyridoxal-dependent decarboxylase [Saprospiraceae bacterium]
MEESALRKLYDPEIFRRQGHDLIDHLADSLKASLNAEDLIKVTNGVNPQDEYEFWMSNSYFDVDQFFRTITERSIKLHHLRFMGHQVSPPAPLSVLASLQGAFLNNGMALFEMGPAASALERMVVEKFRSYFGFHQGTGVMTSGGTIANLTALICARNVKAKGVLWNEGQTENYAFMVSDEAHYCIDRAVKIMVWGDRGLIRIPVDDQFRMRTDLLEENLIKAQQKGVIVLGVIGSAPSTSSGIYDDLDAIGSFCSEHHLWYHIDAAHGGPAAFSEKFKYLMSGSQKANSITVDAHKMMMTPALTTMLLFRDDEDSFRTFAQKAQYLWNESEEEWFNYGKRTLECTKVMLSIRVWVLIQTYGIDIFEKYLDACYQLGRTFADMIRKESCLELPVSPDSNIVCFRVRAANNLLSDNINRQIRNKVYQEGKFYIVQTTLNGNVYLRVSLMNPFTTTNDLKSLIHSIKIIYENLTTEQNELFN